MEKTTYVTQKIEWTKLDNEISLALESTPSPGPGESAYNKAPEYLNNDPFKWNNA